ncbi:MAG: helix-turn-helix transcriptional regulator [Roseburia sp.]|nr:helix-turn-helix transcriptional regulator [Roseburia sp.]
MIYAYNEMYLNDAMRNMAEMLDYAAERLAMNMDDFFALFITSGLAEQFGKGTPKFVSGLSGTELAMLVLEKSGMEMEFPMARIDYECSTAYWCGWVLAYYQWVTGQTFKEIHKTISLAEIERLYPTLHEASEDKFVDTVKQLVRLKQYATKLQTLRKAAGYSQRELAECAGINLRTLQQYEIRAKDINKAAASTLAALSRPLGCRMEDLLENSLMI